MFFRRFKNQKGQSMIEYLIIVAVVGISSVAVMRVVGQNVAIRFTNISRVLAGDDRKLEGRAVNTKYYQKKDLSNFMDGAADKND